MDPSNNDPLALPVGALMRPAAYVTPDDSLALAGARLHESGVGVVAVVDGHLLKGVLSESAFACAIADGVSLDAACSGFATQARTIRPYESGAQALRAMTDVSAPALLVVDDYNRLMGVLTPTDLLPRRRAMLRPPMVGGMATPFGVYLTTGSVHAGAPWYALVATGMLLFTLLLVAQTAGLSLGAWLMDSSSPEWMQVVFGSALPIALFFVGMRLLPLSGTHAAEHQVVHAIERGEDLVPSIVRRMPRVHPRCGTNLAVGLSLFLGLASSSIVANDELRLLFALVVTVAAWRPLGSMLQYYVTTRPASDRQLRSAIRAGNDLIEQYHSSRVAVANIPQRIWNSGMLQVISGSFIMYGLAYVLASTFGWTVAL